MTLMQWSDALSVGLDSVDEQHKWLVDATNRLYQELGRESADRAAIGAILEGLMDYTMNHFIMEEELFQRFQYPDADQHKALHDHFTQTIMDTMLEFESGGQVNREVLEFLKNWLVQHIMVADKAYVPFLSVHGVK